MCDNYYIVNIREYLNADEVTYIGEKELNVFLSDFSSPKNPDVEHFLLHNAIEFTKKNQSITYLMLNAESDLLGYFSLAIKPISIEAKSLSKTACKKLTRVCALDEETSTYIPSAYLIAQLGKNYSIPSESQIDGSLLLKSALHKIEELQYEIGGVVEFLECEDNPFLLNFYKQNGFRLFGTRTTVSKNTAESHKLKQLFRLI